MALTPFGFSDPFFSELDKAMDRALHRARKGGFDLLPTDELSKNGTDVKNIGGWHPMDVHETENTYEITADAPGFSPEDIKVELDNNTITISGQKSHELKNKDKEGRVIRQERHFSRFSRSFQLPEAVKADDIMADLDKGVLKITVPRMEPVKKPEPKRIPVRPVSLMKSAKMTGAGSGRHRALAGAGRARVAC